MTLLLLEFEEGELMAENALIILLPMITRYFYIMLDNFYDIWLSNHL